MADCCLIKKVATVEVYENKNEVRAYGFMAGDKNTPMMEVKFRHLWGEENLSKCKLRWIIVDDLGSLLVGEVPIEQDNTASIQLPNELFTGERRMKVQLTVASCDGSRILNLQQFTDLKVINNLASNEVVEPVYQMLINQVYDDTKKYLAELETSYKAKYGSLESVYAKSKASLEQYLINAENGGNAEFLQGYNPKNFNRVENTINELINSAGSKYKVGDVVEVLGYYTAGDGAHHKRKIESADDGSGVQLANGLWANIVHNGEVNVSWFGAKGDGVTDDTALLQRMENYGVNIIVDKNCCVFEKKWVVKKNSNDWVSRNKSKIIKKQADGNNPGPILFCDKISNFVLDGIKFQGYVDSVSSSSTYSNYNNLVCVYGSDNVKITNCEFKDYLIAIRPLKTNHLVIQNCIFTSTTKLDKAKYLREEYKSSDFKETSGDIRSYAEYNSQEYNYNDTNNQNIYIANNTSDSAFLDTFAFVFSQTWKHCSGSIVDNVIEGKNNACQVYRGSNLFVDTGNYEDNIYIGRNKISYCYQTGIYIRGFDGILIEKNEIDLCAWIGTYNSGTNAGISVRIDKDALIPDSNPNKEKYYGKTTILENLITNCDSPTKANGAGGIVCNQRNLTIKRNTIRNDLAKYYGNSVPPSSHGISSNGRPINPVICENVISGVEVGISLSMHSILKNNKFIVNYNKITAEETGIMTDKFSITDLHEIIGNEIVAKAGISSRNTVFEKVLRNKLECSEYGIDLSAFKLIQLENNSYKGPLFLKESGNFHDSNLTSRMSGTYTNTVNGVVETIGKSKTTEGELKSKYNNAWYEAGEVYFEANKHICITKSGRARPGENFNSSFTLQKTGEIYRIDGEQSHAHALINKKLNISGLNNVKIISMERTSTETFVELDTDLSGLSDGGHAITVDEVEFVVTNVGNTIATTLDTPYYTLKMQQENVYEDFVAYKDEKLEYDKEQRYLEEQRQLAFESREDQEQTYEEWLATQPVLIPDTEPQPSEKLLEFKNKYIV